MDFIPTDCQMVAFDMVDRFWNQNQERVAIMTGYAGTGKTTVIREFNKLYPCVVLTPTGKSSLRVREATGVDAITIHRWLYHAETNQLTGEPSFTARDPFDLMSNKNSLIIIDEASMLSSGVWADLLRTAKFIDSKILLVGDPAQLPPVKDEKFDPLGFETQYKAHLDQITRQALDSPIIVASMLIREGKRNGEALAGLEAIGASQVLDTAIEVRKNGGIILVHSNKTRAKLNNALRQKLGYHEDTVEVGEPLLVLKNNYDVEKYNGEVVTFQGWDWKPGSDLTYAVADRNTHNSMNVHYGIGQVDGVKVMMAIDQITGKTLDTKVADYHVEKEALWQHKRRWGEKPHFLHANYGYALTCHKSQGSEFDDVLILFEGSLRVLSPIEQRRWSYTATTRSKKRVRYAYVNGDKWLGVNQ